MFSGIIESLAEIKSIIHQGGDEDDVRLLLQFEDFPLMEVALGDSVAVNGVCLTVVEMSERSLSFDVSNETLNCTSLASLDEGSVVNIERALLVSDRLNGHLVSGHVDTTAEILAIYEDSRSWRFTFSNPPGFQQYISAKGSVAIDGVSLTVNEVDEQSFGVNIVPHTFEHTLFGQYQLGDTVNIEVDMIARYLESLLKARETPCN